MTEHQHIEVDGETVTIQGSLTPEDMAPFAEVVRAAKDYAATLPGRPCNSPRCDQIRTHDHGIQCGTRCLCGQGCRECGGDGIIGGPPDRYADCPACTDLTTHPDDISDDRDPEGTAHDR